MLMSMIAAPRCSFSLAASAMTCGSHPASCSETGSSDWIPQRLLKGLPRLADHRLAGNHLADCQASTITLDDLTERQIGDARHRRQDHWRRNVYGTDRRWASVQLMGRRHVGEQPLADKARHRKAPARMTVTALIVAAGKGERLGGDIPKQFQVIAGFKPVLRWAVEAMSIHPSYRSSSCGCRGLDRQHWRKLHSPDCRLGTSSRVVRSGLTATKRAACRSARAPVLVHDAARPFCPPDVVDRLLAALDGHDGAVPVLSVADTLAKGSDGVLDAPVDRNRSCAFRRHRSFMSKT